MVEYSIDEFYQEKSKELVRFCEMILRWLNHLEAVEFLAELKDGLTPLEQSVYEVYYVQEKSAKDTADVLNIKVNAVNDAARRIRRRAATMRNVTFIFLFSPIFKLFCSIFIEGRQWR